MKDSSGDYQYYPIERSYHNESYPYHNQYYREISYRIDMGSQSTKKQKPKEIKANIPKRALMLEKASDEISSLPQLSSVLWKIIAEYEGGVELSLLGAEQESSIDNFCPYCAIM